ncbi:MULTISPECIES: hypothetical protein [Subtercola]|nr:MULTISPECIES: hypothetical protein [Subtercola]MEA9984750.1 hypothetical protein [Subtercola sp. RTI3]
MALIIVLSVLGLLALAAIVATTALIVRDGYRPVPTRSYASRI